MSVDDLDHDVLEQFVELFRDKYAWADEANHYLEAKGFSAISVTVTNQRDALSHFVTFISGKATTKQDMDAQLSSAEEHLRRAIIEPYQIVAQKRAKRLGAAVKQYEDKTLALTGEETKLLALIDRSEISAQVSEIDRLISKGRSAKALNMWTPDWEAGIKAFTLAVEKAEALTDQLTRYAQRANELRKMREEDRRTEKYLRRERKFHIVLLVIALVVGALLSELGRDWRAWWPAGWWPLTTTSPQHSSGHAGTAATPSSPKRR